MVPQLVVPRRALLPVLLLVPLLAPPLVHLVVHLVDLVDLEAPVDLQQQLLELMLCSPTRQVAEITFQQVFS